MRKSVLLIMVSFFMILCASCQKTPVTNVKGNGYLSFSEFSLGLDEEVITKATPANGTYEIIILDSEGTEVLHKTYKQVKENDDKISLPAGNYTLVARSSDEVPVAAFEQPVYGVEKPFSITAGEVTVIGNLVCTLVQCKVTVSYSDEFLAAVTGAGATTVTVTPNSPLVYELNENKSYNSNAGYFAVNGNTMEVTFKGSIDGKSQKMTKTFTGIAAKQWRKIKFVEKRNEQGDAVFDIVINDLIDDEELNNAFDADDENVIDEYDPEAPKGDGGITLGFDYEAGCDAQLTDLNNMVIVPVEERVMSIKLKAVVPNAVKKFTVDIESDNEGFIGAVELAEATHLDLINPKEENMIIFDVVPFPHGADLYGQTEVSFDLSNAQEAILIFPGTHVFKMTIIDQEGCKNTIPVTMVVGK